MFSFSLALHRPGYSAVRPSRALRYIHPRMRLANKLLLKFGSNYKFTELTLKNNLGALYIL